MAGKKKTLDEFLRQAREKHNNRYTYEKIKEYPGSFGKITVTCSKHGDFITTPSMHLSGSGCPKCAREDYGNKFRKTNEDFIKEARKIHGNKYDYSKTNYTGRRKRITITCPIHGDQETTAENHLRGLGCPCCSHEQSGNKLRFTKELFIEKAREVHGDKYDYSKSVYRSMKIKTIITCPIHGDFLQKPHDHIKGKTGCPICNSSKMETEIRTLLKLNNISFKEQKTWDWLIYKSNQKVDFFLPEKNLVIECQGEQHFKEVKYFSSSFEDNKKRDENKLNLCNEHGIRILYYSNLGENFDYPYKVFTDINDLINEIKNS